MDALMLDMMYARSRGFAARPDGHLAAWSTAAFEHEANLPRGAIGFERLDNLVRLGLCFHPTEQLGRIDVSRSPLLRDRIGLTAYGIAFIKACRPPEAPKPEPTE